VHPLERLVNLTALMLTARRPLTFDEIRDRIEAYQQQDHASSKRMFERDKDILRDVGIPVDLIATDPWDVEKGYQIVKDLYYLPDIQFTAEEMWALFVAAHASGADDEAEFAFRKLAAGADDGLFETISGRQPAPGVDVSGPHLATVAAALAARRRIRFRYRPIQGRAGIRRVDPYALIFRRGAWYLVGLDADRKDVRSYRLSRIRSDVDDVGEAGPPPDGFEASRYLEAGPLGDGGPPGSRSARISFSDKVGWLVAATTRGARLGRTTANGWVEIDVPTDDPEGLAAWVMSFGGDARVLSPRSLRDEVVRRLEAISAEMAS
jgi:predicted DNA-binding transcriptional regulator YafY